MAKTPEGKVKDDVRKALAENHVHPFMEVAMKRHDTVYGAYYMPVAGPMTTHGIHDFVGCWHGLFFSIETKSPDNPKDETPHQGMFREAFCKAGGVALTGVRDGKAAVDYIKHQAEKGRNHGH